VIAYAIAAAIVAAFALSALATAFSKGVAVRFGMLDVPQRHKAHARAVPMLGGSAIFATFLMLALLALVAARYWAATGVPAWLPSELAAHVRGAAAKAPQALGILVGALLLHVVGLVDDRKDLGAWLKLICQLIVATGVVVFFGVRILTVAGPAVSSIVSVIWLVTIINAFNFLDNMDGLAAGVALIVAASLLAASAMVGQVFVPAMLCLVVGALAGFLLFNFPPASVFMGDAGSLVIGYLLGVASCLTTYVRPGEPYYAYGVFVPLVIMAVPLYDMVSVVSLRLRERRNPMVGDRRHFSHRLLRRGMSVRKAAITIYLCTAATAVGAALLGRVGPAGAGLVFAQTLMILLILALLESTDGKG